MYITLNSPPGLAVVNLHSRSLQHFEGCKHPKIIDDLPSMFKCFCAFSRH